MFSDQLLEAASKEQPASPVPTPQVSPPLTLPTGNDPPSVRIQPVASTAGRRAEYRPLPKETNKRKHVSKESRPIRYFEVPESDADTASDQDGDRSSSGDSISDAPAPRKRLRVSRITTRSSTSVPTTDTEEIFPDGDTTLAEAPAICITDTEAAAPANTKAVVPANTEAVVPVNTEAIVPANAKAVVPANTKDTVITDAEDTVAAGTENAVTTDTERVFAANSGTICTPATKPVGALSTTDSTLHSPPSQALSSAIDEASVPTFLLSHGKGKRAVNIFQYLQDVEDPRFQRVLFHYIRFEISCESGVSGSLSTTNRPAEIGYWTSRARPANLPDYTRGKRTFTDFVDSIFMWWASIQPPWRVFERGRVSRKVLGSWDALRSPRINGLLNVVILAYWWIGYLDELKLGDSMRADYKSFVEDVAWVFSELST